jgi:hypothetical protein
MINTLYTNIIKLPVGNTFKLTGSVEQINHKRQHIESAAWIRSFKELNFELLPDDEHLVYKKILTTLELIKQFKIN